MAEFSLGSDIRLRLKANLTLFAVAIIWGTGFITQAVAGKYHVAYLFNGACFMLASVFLIPFFPRGKKIDRLQSDSGSAAPHRRGLPECAIMIMASRQSRRCR